jgi:hypothetical protein
MAIINPHCDKTFRRVKFCLLLFTTLALIATFIGYGVVSSSIEWLIDKSTTSSQKGNWQRIKTISIIVLVIEDLVFLIGLLGTIRENFFLTGTYAVLLTILWIVGFTNYALTNYFIYGYVITIVTIILALIFTHMIRQRNLAQTNCIDNQPTTIIVTQHPNVVPAAIQVTPSYAPGFQPSGSYSNFPPSDYQPYPNQPHP